MMSLHVICPPPINNPGYAHMQTPTQVPPGITGAREFLQTGWTRSPMLARLGPASALYPLFPILALTFYQGWKSIIKK